MKWKISLVFALILLTAGISKAGSIFSSGGLGIYSLNPGGREAGMGVLGIGLVDTGAVGSLNPALWAGINVTRFSGGMSITRFNSRDHFDKDISDDYTLQFVALGISFKPGLTLGFRFHPQTRVDYRLFEIKYLSTDDNYKFEDIYLGKGGVSLGSAILAGRISSRLWLGGAVDLIFGNILTLWRVNFIQGSGSYSNFSIYDPLDTEFSQKVRMLGVRPRIGFYFAPDEKHSLGIFAAPGVEVDVTEEYKYWHSDSTAEKEISVQFPPTAGIGYCFPLTKRVQGIFDFLWTGWERENQGVGDNGCYHESQFFGFGIEYQPLSERYAPLVKRMKYRAGVNYRNLYYQVPAGKTVPEYSLNFGTGIPLSKEIGRVDIALAFGKRGDLGSNGAEELFYSLGIYINTGERMFVRKRKY